MSHPTSNNLANNHGSSSTISSNNMTGTSTQGGGGAASTTGNKGPSSTTNTSATAQPPAPASSLSTNNNNNNSHDSNNMGSAASSASASLPSGALVSTLTGTSSLQRGHQRSNSVIGRTAAAVVGERHVKRPIGQLRARIVELQRQLARAEREVPALATNFDFACHLTVGVGVK
jgi:hypothetical protein